MPLSSWDILTRLRGSTDGLSPFASGSLGAYLTANFGATNSNYEWMIELSNQSVSELIERKLSTFRIGIYERPSNSLLIVEDERPDLITESYVISLFKQMAREEGYNEEEEKHVLDLKDAIINWSKVALVSNLTVDSDSHPTLFNFSYISKNTVIRNDSGKYIFIELYFNAKRQL
jgi:nitrous oxidase accessory protein NosD